MFLDAFSNLVFSNPRYLRSPSNNQFFPVANFFSKRRNRIYILDVVVERMDSEPSGRSLVIMSVRGEW